MILHEIGWSVSQTLIVARLHQEGHSMLEAQNLYERIANNPRHYQKVVRVLTKLVDKRVQQNVNEQAKSSPPSERPYSELMDPKRLERERQQKIMFHMAEKGAEMLAHEVFKKVIGAIFGVRM